MHTSTHSAERVALSRQETPITTSVSVGKPASLPLEIRRVPMGQSLHWLSRGWTNLKHIGRAVSLNECSSPFWERFC